MKTQQFRQNLPEFARNCQELQATARNPQRIQEDLSSLEEEEEPSPLPPSLGFARELEREHNWVAWAHPPMKTQQFRQNLPEFARNCQELQETARNPQRIQEDAKDQQKTSEIARTC